MATQFVPDQFVFPPPSVQMASFVLVANAQPAIVGGYTLMIRTERPPANPVDHNLGVALTRLRSGADHLDLSWTHERAGEDATNRRIHHTAVLDSRQVGSAVGPILYTVSSYDMEAPYITARGKTKAGIHYFLDITPTYRPGNLDPQARIEETRKALASLKSRHVGLLDQLKQHHQGCLREIDHALALSKEAK